MIGATVLGLVGEWGVSKDKTTLKQNVFLINKSKGIFGIR